ncbi:MAG: polymer-forming cytoskeletal protein [Candidatus Saganbacteria bacterium]|nr:polymer-forming cytoskeletal protein [Candidatus Saganbacteria bacterium]
MNFFQKEGFSGAIDTIIGEETFFKGEIKAKGPLRICGQVEGRINSESEVFLGEKSKVRGDIHGGRVVVSGEVFGNIIATSGLEILKHGKVHGDITADKLTMEEGTTYKGKVRVGTVSENSTNEAVAEPQNPNSPTAQIFNFFSSSEETA